MSTTKDDDEYERKKTLPVFTGVDDLDMYMPFMTMFEGWKDKEDTRRLTSIEALVEQLPTVEEYWNDLRECRVVKWLMQTMSNMLFRKH
jgi:hypothetical protein